MKRTKRLLLSLLALLCCSTGAWADKPVATITTAPTAIQDLTYTGSAQTLITAGEASGGTIKYSLDDVNWSESLPTGINWGVYTIRYYAEGDASHTDSEKQQISTLIGKAEGMYDPGEGPWTRSDVRTGWTGYEGAGTSISFNSLNDSKWFGSTYLSNDDDGCGYAYLGNTTQYSKYAVYSVYTHTENVPSYSRRVLTWRYKLLAWSSNLKQTTALYAANDFGYLKALAVDFTEDYTDGSGSAYHLVHLTQETAWGAETSEQTGWFGFDNRSGSTAADKTSALLLTQVIGDNTGVSNYVHNWGSFKHVSSSWSIYYYKHIIFNANGGEGSMSVQEIENSGTLTSNAFTRDGYVFAGWNTEADGTGTNYANGATITATESSKGPVTLYALWTPVPEVTWDPTDAEKNYWTISPVNPVAAGAAVTATYKGSRHVKSVKMYITPVIINSKFTINDSGDKVYFSKGNLQLVGERTWKFADNQWETFGENQSDNHRDLFGWCTVATPNETSEVDDDYSSDNAWGDDPYLQACLGTGWHLITGGNNGKWNYLLNSRTTTSGIRYAVGSVNGKNGLILLPDDWNAEYYALNNTNKVNGPYDDNVISSKDWTEKLEAHGAVFLPAGGHRIGTVLYVVNDIGHYWCSTRGANGDVMRIDEDLIQPNWALDFYYGCSIRLVRDVAE